MRPELKHGPDMLNYRRYPLKNIPEQHHAWLKTADAGRLRRGDGQPARRAFPFAAGVDLGSGNPNLAGYAVIGDETAKYLAKLLRERK